MPEIEPDAKDSAKLEKVAAGQKLIIYAILVGLGAFIVAGSAPQLAPIVYLAHVVMGIIGIFMLATGLGINPALSIVLCLIVVIPLVGIIMLAILSTRATKLLRANGYKVGLLGATKA